MKKYFISGLVVLLPLVVTIVLVRFFINLFTEPFVWLVTDLVGQAPFWSRWKGIPKQEVIFFLSRLLILALLFFATVFVGWMGRSYLVHRFFGLWEKLIEKIPLLSSVHKASKEVMQTVVSPEASSFKKVVSVPYPHNTGKVLGFITRENLPSRSSEGVHRLVSVFIPATPNPTVGYLLLFDPEDVEPLSVSVEDALKTVISCGSLPLPVREGEGDDSS